MIKINTGSSKRLESVIFPPEIQLNQFPRFWQIDFGMEAHLLKITADQTLNNHVAL